MIRTASCCSLLLLTTVLGVSCGSSRTLKTVTILPAAAKASNFPNGKVPFQAGGTYNKPPSPVVLTSKDVSWCIGDSTGACAGNINPGGTVDANGVAQCGPSFTGTLTVLAGSGSSATGNPDSGGKFKVFGSAQLTCP